MTQSLSGQVVFITGAARGIGAQTARVAAARGARVALAGLEPQRLAALRAELGADHAWFECDVTDQASLDEAVRDTVRTFGGIDVVMANAGVVNRGTAALGDTEPLVRTVEVDLVGVIRTVGATVGHVIERRGYFLLVSSAAAFAALPGLAAYCAAKAGVEHFGNAIRLELAHRGVGVGTAHPSWIDTDMVRDAQHDLSGFREAIDRLPWPLGSTTSVEACAAAFVDGIERRQRRVYVPKAIGAVQAVRSLLVSPLSDLVIGRVARTSIPRLEAEVRALGRAFGRNTADGSHGASGGSDATA